MCNDFSQHSTALPLSSMLLFTSYFIGHFPPFPPCTACLCLSPPGLLATPVFTTRANKSTQLPWLFLHLLQEHSEVNRAWNSAKLLSFLQDTGPVASWATGHLHAPPTAEVPLTSTRPQAAKASSLLTADMFLPNCCWGKNNVGKGVAART